MYRLATVHNVTVSHTAWQTTLWFQ